MARGYGNNLIEDEEGKIRPRVPQVIDARAPQHDFSKDVPMSPSAPYELSRNNLTPKGIWDEMFRNRGGNSAAPSPSTAVQPPPSAFGAGLKNNVVPLPTLSVLAAGGQNHAERWMNPQDSLARVQKYLTPGPITGPAPVTRFDSTPGTRQPFIAGANGVNVGPSIAKKVNPNDPTLDPEYLKQKFSWSSAFRSS